MLLDPAEHDALRLRGTRPDLWPRFLPPSRPWRTDWDDEENL